VRNKMETGSQERESWEKLSLVTLATALCLQQQQKWIESSALGGCSCPCCGSGCLWLLLLLGLSLCERWCGRITTEWEQQLGRIPGPWGA